MAVSTTHALADLIDAVEKANSWSDEDVARNAMLLGHRLSKSNVSRIRNQPVAGITAKLVRALADGLQIPQRQVIQAALTSMGLPTGGPPSRIEDVIASDENLSAHDRRVLAGLLQILREASHDRPATKRAAPAARVPITRDEEIADATVDRLLSEPTEGS